MKGFIIAFGVRVRIDPSCCAHSNRFALHRQIRFRCLINEWGALDDEVSPAQRVTLLTRQSLSSSQTVGLSDKRVAHCPQSFRCMP